MKSEPLGRVHAVTGPVVEVDAPRGVRMHDRMRVGNAMLAGEVIRLVGDRASVQVYEDTTGLAPGEPAECEGTPLDVELGPGLLGTVYDGVQRPLATLLDRSGPFIAPGIDAPALRRDRRWVFEPLVTAGDCVAAGDILGTVAETASLSHRILVPPLVSGRIDEIRGGEVSVDAAVGRLDDGTPLTLCQRWPVRIPRPSVRRLALSRPFITGQRVCDFLFPLAMGGAAVVPGGFGTGKTVLEQSLARHASVDVVVFVGCGERGNEITDVLTELPTLRDPRSGRALMERTVIVVNTSNMAVAAREASICTGITIAEYYRDMGYNVAVLADSTSRWAEALREISSRLEEMPGEEGYPTGLANRVAWLYERAGDVLCLGSDGRRGSVTLVGAVSPAGGDLSEPVTQCSLRVAGALWVLDSRLAHSRHFPAVDTSRSYSLYGRYLDAWFEREVASDWPAVRERLMALLQREHTLEEAVSLVGLDALSDEDRLMLECARLLREAFLRQNAYAEIDAHCALPRQLRMARAILSFGDRSLALLSGGVALEGILQCKARERLMRLPTVHDEELDAFVNDALGALAEAQ